MASSIAAPQCLAVPPIFKSPCRECLLVASSGHQATLPSLSQRHHPSLHKISQTNKTRRPSLSAAVICGAINRNKKAHLNRNKKAHPPSTNSEQNESLKKVIAQAILWGAEAVYILWLFLLPYAPGDPVWAISPSTINDLLGLSLNFFFILPFLNSVGIHLLEAPMLHPMEEGLFNFVIGWTFLFAPLLFTDCRRDRYKGSLDLLWGFQMFLTNTLLIPYMAVRLNDVDVTGIPKERSQLSTFMTKGAPFVGLAGGAICLLSVLWALYGRMDGNFGGIAERLEYLLCYLGSERLAYAFIWDICLYSVFQPWLIGANLRNVQKGKVNAVKYLRFVPVVGLVAYLLFLNLEEEYL